PGGGKTTALLALARELVEVARADPGASVPVVLNLSSFRPDRVSMMAWIEEEVATKYSLPKAAARRWIEQGGLMLLLDGLDEILPDRRRACVVALNELRSGHAIPLV